MTDCFCDFDPPDVYNRVTRTARKPHHCSECHGPIKPGEHYEHVDGLWDGQWMHFDTCADCLYLRCQTGCTCWLHGGLHELLLEVGDDRLLGMFRAARKARAAA